MSDRATRVLLVEDDDDDYVVTRDLLARSETERFRLDRVSNYDQAVEAIDRNEHDVYLVDYCLGERTGLDLLRHVVGSGSKTPLILLTGFGNREIDLAAIDAGAADYLVKGQIGAPLLERTIRYAIGRTKALEALRASQRRFQAIFDGAAIGVAMIGVDGRVVQSNPALRRMLGCREDGLRGETFPDLLAPEAGSAARALFLELVEGRREHYQVEERYRRTDGASLWGQLTVSLVRTLAGQPEFAVAMVADVTERKQAEDALQRSEAELRQSQKMEAIGRLAGGVAHDFNNLLTVILGASDFLLSASQASDPCYDDLEEIRKAAERAAVLTRQLLAFGRRQVRQLSDLDLDEVVTSIERMLRRLIGEDVELVMLSARDPARVRADRAQIEQVVLNLAINARDAMPRGGRLTIRTGTTEVAGAAAGERAGVPQGSYVTLTVSDTGHGMDAETLAHAFEPFFTTREPGKGTGLGLATVYGIVEQNGGHVRVESEPGRGTTVEIYLPHVRAAAADQTTEQPTDHQPGGTPPPDRETILLVEDEDAVRSLVREILQRSGYLVLEAARGRDALTIGERHPGPISLMLTDVVMPEMSGREVAQRLTALRADMKVLYMSGYTDNVLGRHGALDAATAFLAKPFTPDALVRKVREVLEAPWPATP